MPHELFVTKRQTTKVRNAFENNMPTDVTLSKDQMTNFDKEVKQYYKLWQIIKKRELN